MESKIFPKQSGPLLFLAAVAVVVFGYLWFGPLSERSDFNHRVAVWHEACDEYVDRKLSSLPTEIDRERAADCASRLRALLAEKEGAK